MTTSSLPAGTVTFLFTDIEGSASLWEREPDAMRAALARHDAIFEAIIAEHAGVLYKHIGDAVQAAFRLPAPAVLAALAAQRALAAEAWPTGQPIRVRMGLHTGPAVPAETDYTTTHTLNRVARIMGAAHGGQVLLSAETAQLTRGDLPAEVSLRNLAEHRMKGLAQLEHLFQLVVPDLPADFPPLATQVAIPNNLPVAVTSFVGREKEIAEAKRLLAGTHLLTLTGSGGTGKTRLSLQTAAQVRPDFRDGVWLIELAPLTDPDQVLSTIAAVLNVREQPGRPSPRPEANGGPLLAALTDYLRVKRLLLILDNCEHLVAACAAAADQLLRACPHLKILASSREGLGIAGETTYHVPSLSLLGPQAVPTVEAVSQCEAARLLIERARAAWPGFTLTETNAPAVAQICRRLDGIPLALELAAARLKVLSVEQLAARLDDRFRLLTGGSRTALPRQQTLRALIDWSYDLLSEPERAALQQFSIFAGGWTLAAAEAVVVLAQDDVLEILGQLVNKSLVAAETEAGGETRYHLLETVRQYAREKLLEAGGGAAVRDRHLEYFVRWAEALEAPLRGPDMLTCLDQLDADHDNVRAALEWGLANDPLAALRLAAMLSIFWGRRTSATEGRAWLRAALTQAAGQPQLEVDGRYQLAWAKALQGEAALAFSLGHNQAARAAIEACIAAARQINAERVLAMALGTGATICGFLGDLATARAWIDESLALCRRNGYLFELGMNTGMPMFVAIMTQAPVPPGLPEEAIRAARASGNPWAIGMTLQNVARTRAVQGAWAEAWHGLDEAAHWFHQLRDRLFETGCRSEQGHVLRWQGRLAEAEAVYRVTLGLWRDLGQHGAVAHELECLAFLAGAQGAGARAARLLGAAEALREAGGYAMTPIERREYEPAVAQLRTQLDAADFAAAWAAGRALALDEAVAYALNSPSPEAVL